MKTRLLNLFNRTAKVAPLARLAEQLEQARVFDKQGNFDAAATLYRELLAAFPADSDVYYRYGNFLKDRGAFEEAIATYDQAIAIRADHAYAYCNRAVALGFLNKFPDALESYDRALAISPGDAIALCNRAILLHGLGQKDAALIGFDATVAQDPRNFTAHFHRGALHQEQQLWTASLAAYEQAIAVNPKDAVTFYNRGVVLRELEQLAEAISSLGKAIELNPEFALAYSTRGELLEQLGKLPSANDDYCRAIEHYDRAIALNPKHASVHMKRALLMQRLGRNDDALSGYDATTALDENNAEVWFNRGTVLDAIGDFHSALKSYERAILSNAGHARAYLNQGSTLHALGRLEAAIASYRQSIVIDPDLPEARYNLALASLANGDYRAGWAGHEWRWHAKSGPVFRERRDFKEPLWLGNELLAGKTILLYAEQGLGDALQFCRYVELVAALGAQVMLEVPRPLVELCTGAFSTQQVIPFGDPLPPFDLQCPLMSLPLAFGTTLENIPAAAGYLTCSEGKLAQWQNRLGARKKPRVGLTWSGNRSAGTDHRRHFELSGLIPFLSDSFHFYCLQTDVSKADQATLDDTNLIFQFPDSELAFTNTAALCRCMDLVISVDTSIAHLSGALGVRTWVLLPFVADWRWLTSRDDTPWYRSARLFRQAVPGDWNGVFDRVATELRSQLDAC